jgi:hypothetical protein
LNFIKRTLFVVVLSLSLFGCQRLTDVNSSAQQALTNGPSNTPTGGGTSPAPQIPKLLALSENNGPLSGDHTISITAENIPLNRNVEVRFGNSLCTKLKVIDSRTITCITPASAATRVDVSLSIDGAEVQKLLSAYEYRNSESISPILTDITGNRFGSTPVIEGNKVYVWGGNFGAQYIAQGRVYNIDTNTWEDMVAVNQPAIRSGHVAVSTGQELIIWGGFNGSYLNTGGRYNFQTKTWIAISTTGAPSPRSFSAAVWTGNKMIVWGGGTIANLVQNRMNDGAIYDPATDTWAPMALPPANIPGRFYHFGFWDGKEMVIWGGYLADNTSGANELVFYNPATNLWRIIATTNSYTIVSIEFNWAWYTGTKWIAQGPRSGIRGFDFTTPKLIDYPTTTNWINFARGLLPNIDFDPEPVRFHAIWNGRYVFLFKNGSGGGFRYSLP